MLARSRADQQGRHGPGAGRAGCAGPTRVTYLRCLKRVIERDYRGVIAAACYAHAARDGGLALVLYDLTTLHFETDVRPAAQGRMSKERRVDPQVTVGCSPRVRFPLKCTCSRKQGETTTLIPVLTAFSTHRVPDLVVVADAGCCPRKPARPGARRFGSLWLQTTSAATDLADHLRGAETRSPTPRSSNHPQHAPQGHPAAAVVYQYSFKRSQHDRRAINKMIERPKRSPPHPDIEEGPVRHDQRRHQRRRLALVERPVTFRAEGLCHQPRA